MFVNFTGGPLSLTGSCCCADAPAALETLFPAMFYLAIVIVIAIETQSGHAVVAWESPIIKFIF
jgi:hypothetical protein